MRGCARVESSTHGGLRALLSALEKTETERLLVIIIINAAYADVLNSCLH